MSFPGDEQTKTKQALIAELTKLLDIAPDAAAKAATQKAIDQLKAEVELEED